VIGIRGAQISSRTPETGQVLSFDGTSWLPLTPARGVTAHSALTGLSNDDHPQYLLSNGARNSTNGFAVTGAVGAGSIPTSGAGDRLMWYSNKAAFRAGGVGGAQWDDLSIGNYSIAGGLSTTASGRGSTAFGEGTQATADWSTAIGWFNKANGAHATALGVNTQATGSYSTTLGHSTSAQSTLATAMGHLSVASGLTSTAMGFTATASGNYSTAMGSGSVASGEYSTATGRNTTASGKASFASGEGTQASGDNSFAMGFNSIASGWFSLALGNTSVASNTNSVAIGVASKATGYAAVAIGSSEASGEQSVALVAAKASGLRAFATGTLTTASGNLSTAMGVLASTNGFQGSFVYGDASSTFTNTSINNVANNEFAVRASGGFRFRTSPDLSTGCNLPAGSGTFACTSDRNRKNNFELVDGESVLDRIAHMPITTWSYTTEQNGVRHMGPTAQDFRAAFGLGIDDLTISTVDIDGVNLAGVKALELRTSLLRAENAELRARLEKLEALLQRFENR
jgi:trimeric autotransporter adhesin